MSFTVDIASFFIRKCAISIFYLELIIATLNVLIPRFSDYDAEYFTYASFVVAFMVFSCKALPDTFVSLVIFFIQYFFILPKVYVERELTFQSTIMFVLVSAFYYIGFSFQF